MNHNHYQQAQYAQYQYHQPPVQQRPQIHNHQQPVGANYQQISTERPPPANSTAYISSAPQVQVSQQGSFQDNATFNLMYQQPPGPSGLQAPVNPLASAQDPSDSD